MITLVGLVFKLVKWTVITVAYLLVGLIKLVSIVVVLIFFTARAALRRLLDAKERDDDDPDEYDLGYPTPLGRSSERLTRDAFDARWQRERDLRIAERRTGEAAERDRIPSAPAGEPDADEMGNAAVRPPLRSSFGSDSATANGLVHHETREHRWNASDRDGQGATVMRP
jgi:hypothetical protein